MKSIPKTIGTVIIFIPGSKVRKRINLSNEHNGRSKGARKHTVTMETSTMATAHKKAEKYNNVSKLR